MSSANADSVSAGASFSWSSNPISEGRFSSSKGHMVGREYLGWAWNGGALGASDTSCEGNCSPGGREGRESGGRGGEKLNGEGEGESRSLDEMSRLVGELDVEGEALPSAEWEYVGSFGGVAIGACPAVQLWGKGSKVELVR